MKTLKLFISVLFIFLAASCSNDTEDLTLKSNNLVTEKTELLQIKNLFESKNFKSIEDAVKYSHSLMEGVDPITRAFNEDDYVRNISPAAMAVIDSFKSIKVDEESSPEKFRNQLISVIKNSDLSPTSQEYHALLYSVDITIEAIYYAMNIESPVAKTRGFWSSTWKVIKCVGGTAGSAGLGVLAGASVGTVTLPVVGTVSGTALGGWSGALVGMATFC